MMNASFLRRTYPTLMLSALLLAGCRAAASAAALVQTPIQAPAPGAQVLGGAIRLAPSEISNGLPVPEILQLPSQPLTENAPLPADIGDNASLALPADATTPQPNSPVLKKTGSSLPDRGIFVPASETAVLPREADKTTLVPAASGKNDLSAVKKRVAGGLAALSKDLAPAPSVSAELDAHAAAAAYDGALASLDPELAERCIRDERMQQLLQSDISAAAGPLSKAYALSDLASFLKDTRRTRQLNQGLLLRIRGGTPLDMLGFNKTRTFLDWVRRFLPKREAAAKRASLEWETLPAAFRDWAVMIGKSAEYWTALLLDIRDLSRWDWTKKAYSSWLEAPAPEDARAWRAFLQEARAVSIGVGHSELFAINDRITKTKALLHARIALRKRLEQGKHGEAEKDLEKVFALPQQERSSALVQTALAHPELFSERLLKKIGGQSSSKSESSLSQTSELPSAVVRALFSELEGTQAGSRVLALYPPGTLPKIALEDGPFIAKYVLGSRNIVCGRRFIEGWLDANGYTPETLSHDPAAQKRFARRLTPVVVHEATHHKQALLNQSAGLIEDPLQEEEIEAFTEQFTFILEKAEQDPSFIKDIDDNDALLAEKIRTRPAEIASMVRRVYADLPSLRTRLAAQLGLVFNLTLEIASLDDDGTPPPAAFSLEDLGWIMQRAVGETAFHLRYGLPYALTRNEMILARDYAAKWSAAMASRFAALLSAPA
ncbi:MAG: hypothetical protein WCU88_03315 [Elusimicrobiota bacterium]|jgi:hypothetical protein